MEIQIGKISSEDFCYGQGGFRYTLEFRSSYLLQDDK